jgi:hypothetical protein
MDREQILDRSSTTAPVTFDRDRLLDLVGDLERDIALVETAMEDIERDNYDSVDAALVALTPSNPGLDAPQMAASTALAVAPTTALIAFTPPDAAPSP